MKEEGAKISAVIPAYNEAKTIGGVIEETQKFVDEIIVVDDGSTDGTKRKAEKLGAKTINNKYQKGYIGAIKSGFEEAKGDVIVTLDADGEHAPQDIPRLIQPIAEGKADLVLGKRTRIPRLSERLINWLANLKIKVSDPGTGFRAMRRGLALRLTLRGKCTCGIFALEANYHGARIVEVPITVRSIPKRRKIMWGHFWQILHVLPWLVSRQSRPGIGETSKPEVEGY